MLNNNNNNNNQTEQAAESSSNTFKQSLISTLKQLNKFQTPNNCYSSTLVPHSSQELYYKRVVSMKRKNSIGD